MIPGWIYGFSLFRWKKYFFHEAKNTFSIKQKVTSLKNPTQCSESLSSEKPIRGWRAVLQMGKSNNVSEGILISMHTLWLQCKLQCDEWRTTKTEVRWWKMNFRNCKRRRFKFISQLSQQHSHQTPPTNDGVENFIKMQLLNCILIWNISQVTRFVVAEKINLFWELSEGKEICLRYSLLHWTWKKILHLTLSEVATHLTIIFHRNLAEEWSPAKPLTQSKHMAQSSWRSSRAFSVESILQTLCRCRARGSNCNRSHSAGQALL